MFKFRDSLHLVELLNLIDTRNVWYSGSLKSEICNLIARDFEPGFNLNDIERISHEEDSSLC